jgi:hypothetical protein
VHCDLCSLRPVETSVVATGPLALKLNSPLCLPATKAVVTETSRDRISDSREKASVVTTDAYDAQRMLVSSMSSISGATEREIRAGSMAGVLFLPFETRHPS